MSRPMCARGATFVHMIMHPVLCRHCRYGCLGLRDGVKLRSKDALEELMGWGASHVHAMAAQGGLAAIRQSRGGYE